VEDTGGPGFETTISLVGNEGQHKAVRRKRTESPRGVIILIFPQKKLLIRVIKLRVAVPDYEASRKVEFKNGVTKRDRILMRKEIIPLIKVICNITRAGNSIKKIG